MASGTGIRAAAILMAGLVGAAVIAPGVAFAQGGIEPPTVCSVGEVLGASGDCVTPKTADPDPVQVIPTIPETGSQKSEVVVPDVTTPPKSTTTTPEVTPEEQVTGTEAPVQATAAPVTTAAVTDSLAGLTGFRLPSGLPITDALANLPLGNLDLGGTIPTLPSSGSFTSPRDACLFLASRVTVGDDAVDALSGQFASFCNALPGSFDPSSGYPDLPSLADALDRLCHGLKDTHVWHHSDGRDDINCPEVSYDQAQQILAEDPSDPNNLDGDNDGEACEDNPRDYETVSADYDGYPQGGVATGDSAPGLEPGLAGALAGLALATVAGTAGRRDERDETDRRDELVDR